MEENRLHSKCLVDGLMVALILSFLVNSPKMIVFLKNIDTSNISKNANNLFELLDIMVDDIGEENVVQVIIDSAST